MHPVSSVHPTMSVTYSRTQTSNRATTDPVPDAANADPADLRSRLQGGEALQAQAESAGVEVEETTTLGEPSSTPMPDGPSALLAGVASLLTGRATPPSTSTGASPSSSSGLGSGRDAARAIEDLASTMALDTATVRQSIDDGSLSQLLAQNGVQSSIGMLFNTKL